MQVCRDAAAEHELAARPIAFAVLEEEHKSFLQMGTISTEKLNLYVEWPLLTVI